MSEALPKMKREKTRVWDSERGVCGGYLVKKAGKGSAFMRGKWQKRWFFIKLDLLGHENYKMEYTHTPDESISQKPFELAGAHVTLLAGNSFQLTCADETILTMASEEPETRDDWVITLEHAIETANTRNRIIQKRLNSIQDDEEEDEEEFDEEPVGESESRSHEQEDMTRSQSHVSNSENGDKSRSQASEVKSPKSPGGKKLVPQVHRRQSNPFMIRHRVNPELRVDIDINSMPPSSTQRRQFEEMFGSDLATALGIDALMVEVISLKPAIGMDWLTVVEFDIVSPRREDDDEDDEDDDYEMESIRHQEFAALKIKLLQTIHAMVGDTSSPLFKGFITCKIDPNYSRHLVDDFTGQSQTFHSPVPNVMAILTRYKDVSLPHKHPDHSYFTIVVCFEDRIAQMPVPNPLVWPHKRHCAIWPYEVKQALGLTGTLQELWIEPKVLIPKDMPKALTQPIHFEPSARLGGATVINASWLKADLTYDVICEDWRKDIKDSLTEEEFDEIQATFEEYDVNGDGVISRFEIEKMVRERTQERRDLIEHKFIEATEGSNISPEEYQVAEESKRQHLQHVNESMMKLVKMFESADVNGDGTLSFDEFFLAEVWWMRCTLNPEHAHLF